MSVTKKWLKSANLYKFFTRTYTNLHLDFSDESAKQMFDYESRGIGLIDYNIKINNTFNGFAVGKHLMDVQLSIWKESLNDPFILSKYELLNDPELKEIKWFLEEQFGPLDEEDICHYIPRGSTEIIKYIRNYLNNGSLSNLGT